MLKIRISLVDYLNSAPLGWSFLHGPLKGEYEVVLSSPARCAEQLAAGEADIGLIPSIEYQRIPDLQIIPGIAVAAVNKVRSVLMVRPRNKRELRSLALDTSSRTSVALIRLLLEFRLGLKPVLVPHPPDLTAMLRACDAALLIGDAALKLSPEEYGILDLAEEWIAWQKCPFVFAFWACRPGLDQPVELARAFREAKAWGLGARESIVDHHCRSLGLPAPFLRDYLHFNIDYDLGAKHLEGLKKFYRLAFEAGLIPEIKPLRFLPLEIEVESPVR